MPIPRNRHRPGVALVKVCLCLTVIVGMMALNLDGGRLMDERRRARAAADAATLAAGADLYQGYWTNYGVDVPGTARAAALKAAADNGYPADKVTVNIPPLSGEFAGKAGHVEVLISTSLSGGFSRIFTKADLPVTARSVAKGAPVDIGIILLREDGAAAFNNSAVAFGVVNKPLIVNSKHPNAFLSTGLAFLNISRIDVTGGAINSTVLSLGMKMRTDIRPTLDPLARLPIPDTASLPVRSSSPLTLSLLPAILQPGVYRGGIHATGVATVVMLPGTYVMDGGGFQVDGLATVAGVGTTVYNAAGSYPAGPISVSGVGKVVMTAPLSGTYQGINFFQQRNVAEPVSITGLGLTTITGVVYAAKAPVALTGSAAAGVDILGGAYVADSMTVKGVGAVTVNLNLNPPRVPDVRLVE